jgi:hypothetical protein
VRDLLIEPVWDQRQQSGFSVRTDAEEVEAFWHEHMQMMEQARGVPFNERPEATEFRESSKPLVAHINHGRWVAVCPFCNGGIAVWRDNPKAACLDCGTIYTNIEWPNPAELKQVLRAAAELPEVHMRNWHPGRETAEEAVEKMAALKPPSEEERIAAETGLKPATIRKVLEAQGR